MADQVVSPGEPITVVRTEAEAVEGAHKLAASFAVHAEARDRDRRLPGPELDELSRSGLLGITVPASLGGAAVSVATLTEVFRVLATADPSIAQIPHSHFVFLDALRRRGTPAQQRRFLSEALTGHRFANAQAERGGATAAQDGTTLRRRGAGYLLSGQKFYCTGALFAHWLVVRAVLADEPPLPDGAPRRAVAYLPRGTPGITVHDDWNGMGQRTTASGTVTLDGVAVPADSVLDYSSIFDGPTTYGARAQVSHAAIDAGIARAALDIGLGQAAKARPWFESGLDRAVDEPLLIQRAGELEITVRAAEALLREAAAGIDAAERDIARREHAAESTARASVATAVAKVACDRAAVEVSSALFELGGTRSAAESLNLSRYWRDARTHTLHDPSRWKVQHIGRWVLSGTPPPRHGQL